MNCWPAFILYFPPQKIQGIFVDIVGGTNGVILLGLLVIISLIINQ